MGERPAAVRGSVKVPPAGAGETLWPPGFSHQAGDAGLVRPGGDSRPLRASGFSDRAGNPGPNGPGGESR